MFVCLWSSKLLFILTLQVSQSSMLMLYIIFKSSSDTKWPFLLWINSTELKFVRNEFEARSDRISELSNGTGRNFVLPRHIQNLEVDVVCEDGLEYCW